MAHEYVKISELDPTSSFGSNDQFVIVQNEETVKISGVDLIDSLVSQANLASRSYVTAIVDTAPETLNTLKELAAALNDDANFAVTVSNLISTKLNTADFGLHFWNEVAELNTYHIVEGSNLYWTQERFDTALASKNTYHLAEGSNLYFTEQRVLDVVVPLIPTDINQLTDASHLLGQGGGSYPTTPTFTTVTTTQLNVKSIDFTGTGAVTFKSGNDINFVAPGDITFNGDVAITKSQLKSIVAASVDFADFKSRIANL
jgi:hypothetical protein